MLIIVETSNKGHSERGHTSPTKDRPKVLMYTHSVYRKSPLKEDKMAGPKGVLIKRFHCIQT